MEKYPISWPQFYTATIIDWKPLLEQEKHKFIIIDTLRYLTLNKRALIYSFVIMHNHVHLIWQALPGFTPVTIQHSFMKYTARRLQFDLQEYHPELLPSFKVSSKDREYQFWKRNSLGIELISNSVFLQKLEYIHWNPSRAGLCLLPEEYFYSSAKFYKTGIDDFGILTHW